MPILQMDVEVVQENSYQLRLVADLIQEQISRLNSSLANLDYAWSGRDSELFISDVQYRLRQLQMLHDDLQLLARILDRHAENWRELDLRNAWVWRTIA